MRLLAWERKGLSTIEIGWAIKYGFLKRPETGKL